MVSYFFFSPTIYTWGVGLCVCVCVCVCVLKGTKLNPTKLRPLLILPQI